MTQSYLKTLLEYDPKTGHFTWKVSRGKAMVGNIAGLLSSYGYRLIGIDGKLYFSGRLVWFYQHGRWPEPCIDHINGRRDDDRLINLREVSYRMNNVNTIKHRSGHLIGTTKRKEGWIAQIQTGKRRRRVGPFPTALEAHQAYNLVS